MEFRRWRKIGRIALAMLAVVSAGFLGGSEGGDGVLLPDASGQWSIPGGIYAGRAPTAPGMVEIRGVRALSFDPAHIQTLRPDLFMEGYFSVFDVLVYLAERGDIQLAYVWDRAAATHRILSLNGLSGWWYDARYAGGEYERPVVRMDHFPVKDGMSIRLYLEQPDRLTAIHQSFRNEVKRRAANGGVVIIPEVTIRGPRWTLVAHDVIVAPTGTRSDVFRPGVVTALDVLLALGRDGVLTSVKLVWHDRLEDSDHVDSFMVHALRGGGHEALATDGCMFAHQTGSDVLEGFIVPHGHGSSHIHLSADLEPLVSPEHVRWTWLCR